MTIEELYIRTLNIVYVIFGYDIPCCSRVVIFDNFVVLVSRFYWCFFFNIALIICNKSDRYKHFCWVCCVGPGARLVVKFSREGASVCGGPLLRYLGYTLEWSLVLEHVCTGGGG